MGKAAFVHISDGSSRLQIYVRKADVKPIKNDTGGVIDDEGKGWELFGLLDHGDFIGVEGYLFVTRTGELSVHVQKLQFLAKALLPLPDKMHGIHDPEIRQRQRYADLIAGSLKLEHEEGELTPREVFERRSAFIRELRRILEDHNYIEVETPMLTPLATGAAARPFKTHHNALDIDLYARIAPELYLKRLLVGGFNKVFELNRNFRNEGISRKHNPEFTMLEAYWAYADFEKIADLVEEMICHLATTISPDGTRIEHKDAEGNVTRTLNFTRPWRRARYRDLIREVDSEWFNYPSEKRRERCAELGVEINPRMADYEVTQQVFEKLVEEKTFDPVFVTHCPKELVPLAKQNVDDDSIVDVYELIINGQEISPGYTELNDPIVQRQRLLEQAGEETQKLDEEFLLALEHGMPPAGGFGVGIDRLVMLLTGAESIRDVILFPQLKPKR